MQFLYIENPANQLILTGDEHKYLFKVRRIKKNELIKIRNLKDDYLYIYKIDEINKKNAFLTLVEKKHMPNKPEKFFHIAWCIIDTKNIEKILPSLNEIGVGKITFVYCDFSQRNFKLKIDRIKKILINSCQQCGRSDLMEIEILNSSKEFFEKYKNFSVLNFNGKKIDSADITQPVLIGPEGGFSESEEEKFTEIYKLEGFILRSESAACAISAKILL
ncbi:16S rRNA (uracil1498-N3)-methyltransferase [Lebetimonas natsushimae]|uniref:Ribosomal RNA small subunit methyltransferase E n=1 Tax=Lebetimonas natsushimae TaxID=1936991 RepID=A0A292YF11_9BACT|nr:16S rRNA (uracil(1498)-N(3))-methyltransferase [Lebetimonas natsushimae]GAX87695.1 16S rRNA (uracil1498-N3)-methyltransferase [Lebetimonas natsushimae]